MLPCRLEPVDFLLDHVRLGRLLPNVAAHMWSSFSRVLAVARLIRGEDRTVMRHQRRGGEGTLPRCFAVDSMRRSLPDCLCQTVRRD